MIKGFKVRLYPTKEQEQKIWQHIGASRFIWNYMLNLQKNRYENREKKLSRFEMMKLLTPLKKEEEYKWLSLISCHTLQRACTDLNEAYNLFFKVKGHGHPKFKSRKRSKPNYPVPSEAVYFNGNKVNIIKIGKVKYKSDNNIPLGKEHKFTNARISNVNGKWILSFGMECENQAPSLTDKKVGIDLGIKETMTVAHGDEKVVFHNINKSKKMRTLSKRLKWLQRGISRKYEANKDGNKFVKTNHIIRDEERLKKLYARIKNIRNDYNHQMTHKIVLLLPQQVVMEDLNVSGMMKNKHLSKAVGEQCFYEIIRQMKYKCEWNGIKFIQADRFYPSSKMCSCCGHIKKDLKLSNRTYVCSECGLKIDRDYNAAINLQRYVPQIQEIQS